MDAKNSRGRTVSLLNEEVPRLSNLARVVANDSSGSGGPGTSNSHLHHGHTKPHPQPLPPQSLSRPAPKSYPSSSTISSPALSPLPPPSSLPSLSRSGSDDSRAFRSPGPTTPPSAGLGSLPHAVHQHDNPSIDAIARIHISDTDDKDGPSSPMDYSQAPPGSNFTYPNMAMPPHTSFDPTTMQNHTALQNQANFQQPSPVFDQQAQASFSTPMTSTSQRPAKKNTYPCPLSKQYNCGEYFTTSGHAARHAKKHTGKKDALCPECGKGFTRKDNMEQHRRTHAGGRNGANSTSTAAATNTLNNDSSAANTNAKYQTKEVSEESKARKKTQQQRKARPSSISTPAPPQMPIPQPIIPQQQQQSTTTSTGMMPPQVDLLDPALREHAVLFSNGEFGGGTIPFPTMHQQQLPGQHQQYTAPHAPMHRQSNTSQRSAAPNSSQAAMRLIPEPVVSDQSLAQHPLSVGPSSPSLAPKLDALALAAEDVRRRDSDPSP